jgi:MFS family permease
MSMPMVHVIAHASDLGHAPARAAEILALLLLTSFVSRLLWGALADRIGGLRTLAFSSSGQALMLAGFLFVDGLGGLYIVAALYGLAYGGIVPTYSLIVREHFPAEQLGSRIGVVYLFGTIGMAAGGVVGGFVFDLAGDYFAAFSVGLAFNVANLVLIVPLVLRERRAPTVLSASPA